MVCVDVSPSAPSPAPFGDVAPRGFGEPEKRVQRERGQSQGDVLVPRRGRRLCWAGCNGVGVYWGAPRRAETPALGSGLCLVANKGSSIPTDRPVHLFPAPTPPPAAGRI